MILVRLAVFAVPLTVLALLAGSAGAVLPKTLYGKPGKVQILPAEGAGVRVSAGQKPTIKVPAHTIRRSALKPRDSQKICSTFKVSIPATAPATGWVVAATGGPFCGWVKPGSYQKIGNWIWQGEYAKEYHVQYDVTWATKKKKKLAAVTYDLNAETDYKCTTLNCVVSADADKVPYLTFFG
jgi:hypothetical protein